MPALGVAQDDVGAADVLEHGAGDFAGEGSFGFPEHILSTQADGRVFERLIERAEEDEGRADGDANARLLADAGLDGFGELQRLFEGGGVQLPVSGDEQRTHQTATPSLASIVRPSRSASCLSWVIRLSYWVGKSD